MKKLSDYKGEEAIELWADLFEPFTLILADPEIHKIIGDKKPMLEIAKVIFKKRPKEVVEVLKIIDGEEVNGANAFMRLMNLLMDMLNSVEGRAFFESAAQGTAESSGNVTEITEEKQI